VSDDRAELTRGDLSFALDGRDRLVYDSARLSRGQHTVEITATDDAGNTTEETRTFRVVRR